MVPQDSRAFKNVVVVIGVLFYAQNTLACPENALNLVQQCTSDVLPKLATGSGQQATIMNNVQDSCRSARLKSVAYCIQQILDQCKGTTEQEQTLQRLIDKDRMMDTVDYFCRHLSVYTSNAKCISDIHDDVSKCTNDARESFQDKIMADAKMDVLITGSCRFHGIARMCLTNHTLLNCGAEAGEFVFTLLTGHIPPYCDEIHESIETEYTRSWSTERRGRTTNDDNSGSGLHVSNIVSVALTLILSRLFQVESD